jgi:hypothetical protein
MNDAFISLLSITVAAVVFAFSFTAAERVFGKFGKPIIRKPKR